VKHDDSPIGPQVVQRADLALPTSPATPATMNEDVAAAVARMEARRDLNPFNAEMSNDYGSIIDDAIRRETFATKIPRR